MGSDGAVIGAFSEKDAVRLTGLSRRQLRAWDRSGFFDAGFSSHECNIAYGRLYSFRDIVSLRVLGQLRNVHKVPMQELRRVSQQLASFGDARWTSTTLYVLRKRIVFVDPKTAERREIVSGQRVFDIPLRVAMADMRTAIRIMNSRQANDRGKFTKGRFVMQGEPVFAGTRIPVSSVSQFFEAGSSTELILREFPDLTADDLEAVRGRFAA